MKNKLIFNYQKRAYLFMALSLIIMIFGFWGYFSKEKPENQENLTKSEVNISQNIPKEKTKEPEIKESASIFVPYTVQAPNANWAVHEESCEEAAILMYHQFLIGDETENLDPITVDSELRKMKAWQVRNYGIEPDLTIEALGKLAKDYYGHSFEMKAGFTIDDIKIELSKGNPVLVPVMTHSLGNPHYGPRNTYHILLIKGYNQGGVFTNDAGIREGKDYFYTWETLLTAVDAQTQKMNQGRKFLVLK